MSNMDRFFLIVIFIHTSFLTYSQDDTTHLITLDEAVKRALEENPDIIVSRYDAKIAENNATPGNAGLLPSITLNGGYTEEINDAFLQFASPEQAPIDRTGARSSTFNASAQLNYNIFGGLEKYNRYENLLIQSDISDTQTRLTVESTINQVFNVYLQTARLSEQVRISQQTLETSFARYQRVQERYQFGGATKLEVLNAKVDLNADSINLAQADKNRNNNKRALRVLMGSQPDQKFQVATDFNLNDDIVLNEIMDKAMNNNVNMVLAQLNRENAEIQKSIAKSGYYPDLNLSASYSYLKTENEASFIESQENLGFSGSVNLSYPLFNGFRNRTEIENAKISVASSEANLEYARKQVRRDVLNAYSDYENNLYLLNRSRDDLLTAELNFERSQEAYQTGQINSTEFRQAQLNLIQAEFRISELMIQTKISEVELYRLAGTLIN